MINMEFRDPWLLLVALLAPLAARWMMRPRGVAQYSSADLLDDLPRSLRQSLRWLPAVLVGLAVVGLSVALARPRSPRSETRIRGQGIAIMLVIDRSGSMDARDLVPDDIRQNRLDVVKTVVRAFVLGEHGVGKGRPNDVIGLVTFAAFADGICPLTMDHGNLVQLIEDTQLATVDEDGTAVGDGLGLAVSRLRECKVASKVVILLTDGQNNAGVVEPLQAAMLAKDSQIRVYCIGAGTRGRAPIPQRDELGRTYLVSTYVDIDERTLRRIARESGGKYFRATDLQSLAEVYTEIDQLEKSEVSEVRYLLYDEHYFPWVMTGFVLLILAFLADALWFRPYP
jgi:Ca-activated chloride channel family protein